MFLVQNSKNVQDKIHDKGVCTRLEKVTIANCKTYLLRFGMSWQQEFTRVRNQHIPLPNHPNRHCVGSRLAPILPIYRGGYREPN